MRLLLVAFVLFALWHVSQHDAQTTDNGGHCEICRFNHMPTIGGAAQVLFAALFVCAVALVARNIPSLRSKSFLPRLARGPPSF